MEKAVDYRTFCLALRKLQNEVCKDRRIEIFDLSTFDDKPIQLGVNWASIGTVPAAEAREFAQLLMDAATAAENFEYNGYTINYGRK